MRERVMHAWLRPCAGAFTTNYIELLSHVGPAVSFQTILHTIEIRGASNGNTKLAIGINLQFKGIGIQIS
jgi:hypothetical protein